MHRQLDNCQNEPEEPNTVGNFKTCSSGVGSGLMASVLNKAKTKPKI